MRYRERRLYWPAQDRLPKRTLGDRTGENAVLARLSVEYFDTRVYLSQTGQLHMEAAAQALGRLEPADRPERDDNPARKRCTWDGDIRN